MKTVELVLYDDDSWIGGGESFGARRKHKEIIYTNVIKWYFNNHFVVIETEERTVCFNTQIVMRVDEVN